MTWEKLMMVESITSHERLLVPFFATNVEFISCCIGMEGQIGSYSEVFGS